MPSSHLILCLPLLFLPPIPPSIRVFSNESTLPMRWPKYWSFSFTINPSNEHPGLVSFRMDWLDLLTVQGTLKSLLQHHSSKATVHNRCPKGSGFQPVFILPPGGHLAMSGDIFGCHNWVGVVTGIERPEKLLIALEGTGQPSNNKELSFTKCESC